MNLYIDSGSFFSPECCKKFPHSFRVQWRFFRVETEYEFSMGYMLFLNYSYGNISENFERRVGFPSIDKQVRY